MNSILEKFWCDLEGGDFIQGGFYEFVKEEWGSREAFSELNRQQGYPRVEGDFVEEDVAVLRKGDIVKVFLFSCQRLIVVDGELSLYNDPPQDLRPKLQGRQYRLFRYVDCEGGAEIHEIERGVL